MRFVTMVLAALLAMAAATPAAADVGDFLGVWTNPQADASGIVRIVVAPGDGSIATIRIFGRCKTGECDWGAQRARTYADDPGSKDVRALAADFDTPDGHVRIVLRQAVGHALRFDVLTDFTDGSGRSNFAASGAAAFAGDWNVAPRVADAAPAVGAAPTPPPPSSGGGWFGSDGGTPLIGFGPAVPAGYAPAAGEDCQPFNPQQVIAPNRNGSWHVVDFTRDLVNFGPDHPGALNALNVLAFYHFDEECVVKGSSPAMIYWKRGGAVPRDDMPGQDCVALDPATVKAELADGSWKVMSAGGALLDYGEDKDAAGRAVSVIRTYKLSRQCFFSPGHAHGQYWLAQ